MKGLPHTVQIEIDRARLLKLVFIDRKSVSEALGLVLDRQTRWIRENAKGRWNRPYAMGEPFSFEHQEDATLFKMFHG